MAKHVHDSGPHCRELWREHKHKRFLSVHFAEMLDLVSWHGMLHAVIDRAMACRKLMPHRGLCSSHRVREGVNSDTSTRFGFFAGSVVLFGLGSNFLCLRVSGALDGVHPRCRTLPRRRRKVALAFLI